MAQEVPQTIVDDLVVGIVPTSACPGGDLREDVRLNFLLGSSGFGVLSQEDIIYCAWIFGKSTRKIRSGPVLVKLDLKIDT